METRDEQIERILKLTEDTHRIVRAMKRRHTLSSLARLIYIAIFIWASWWAYKQFEPYIGQMQSLMQQVQELNKTAQETKDALSPEVQKAIEKLPSKDKLPPEVQKLLDKLPK